MIKNNSFLIPDICNCIALDTRSCSCLHMFLKDRDNLTDRVFTEFMINANFIKFHEFKSKF